MNALYETGVLITKKLDIPFYGKGNINDIENYKIFLYYADTKFPATLIGDSLQFWDPMGYPVEAPVTNAPPDTWSASLERLCALLTSEGFKIFTPE